MHCTINKIANIRSLTETCSFKFVTKPFNAKVYKMYIHGWFVKCEEYLGEHM